LVQVAKNATGCRAQVNCDALILDERSRSDTYPTMETNGNLATLEHEASVSNVSEEQIFYLTSRGIKKEDAVSMIVNGFIEPIVKELPMEFAVEINRLINMQMEGSVG
jgi:Fe-S cluster assembly protein SufB